MTTDTERVFRLLVIFMSAIYFVHTYSGAVNGTMPPAEDSGPLLEFGLFLWIVMVVFVPVIAVAFIAYQWMTTPEERFKPGDVLPPGDGFPI